MSESEDIAAVKSSAIKRCNIVAIFWVAIFWGVMGGLLFSPVLNDPTGIFVLCALCLGPILVGGRENKILGGVAMLVFSVAGILMFIEERNAREQRLQMRESQRQKASVNEQNP